MPISRNVYSLIARQVLLYAGKHLAYIHGAKLVGMGLSSLYTGVSSLYAGMEPIYAGFMPYFRYK